MDGSTRTSHPIIPYMMVPDAKVYVELAELRLRPVVYSYPLVTGQKLILQLQKRLMLTMQH